MTPTATAAAPTKKTYKVLYEDWEMTVEVDPTDDTITSMDEALAASGQTWMIATSQGVVNEFLKRLAKSILVYSVQFPEARDFDGYLKTWSPWCSVRGVRIVSVAFWKFDDDGFEIHEVVPQDPSPSATSGVSEILNLTKKQLEVMSWLLSRYATNPQRGPADFGEVVFTEYPQLVPLVVLLKEIEATVPGLVTVFQIEPVVGFKSTRPRIQVWISQTVLSLYRTGFFMTQEDGHED